MPYKRRVSSETNETASTATSSAALPSVDKAVNCMESRIVAVQVADQALQPWCRSRLSLISHRIYGCDDR